MINTCPVCHNLKMELIKLRHNRLRHLGFVDSASEGTIARCSGCGLLINGMSGPEENALAAMYSSLEYARAEITGQTFIFHDGRRVARAFVQAHLLKDWLKGKEVRRVLDIGCFKGELLLELSARFPDAEFHGYDVNEHLRAGFPSLGNFFFHLGDLSAIEDDFDLICLSLSMMYVKDIEGLLINMRRLLKSDGRIFIQLVDTEKNPCSLLLADQFYYFTPAVLKNILRKAGFDLVLQKSDYFPRDILGLAFFSERRSEAGFEEDRSLYRVLEHLEESRTRLSSIALSSRLCVLGTTTIAAFVDGVLGDRLQFFVDENVEGPNSVRQFRGKPVVSPESMDKSAALILPYGPANQAIKERFSQDYHVGQFVLV